MLRPLTVNSSKKRAKSRRPRTQVLCARRVPSRVVCGLFVFMMRRQRRSLPHFRRKHNEEPSPVCARPKGADAPHGEYVLRTCCCCADASQSWSPHNLYNLIARSSSPMPVNETSFKKTSLTMYQQRWRAKRLLRGYHGDWIRERRFKRWFLPLDVPRIPAQHSEASSSAGTEERMPIASLFVRDVERRLDTVVFRCCFARSAREARALVIQGKVRLNGDKVCRPACFPKQADDLCRFWKPASCFVQGI